jgi:hypothetical protein
MHKFAFIVAFVVALTMLTGCWKPYKEAQYEEVGTDETGFLIKMEGETDSAKFESEQYLKAAKVAAKKVEITQRWHQTGRMDHEGKWVPDVKLIKVKRSPETRLWTREAGKGTAVSDQAVYVESKDSVNFSVGWTCTAMIQESDTAKFLYYYPAGALSTVMDREILGRIQKDSQNYLAEFNYNDAIHEKGKLQKSVEADVVAYFASRGITITNLGIYGGYCLENAEIQKAIDASVIAQNLKTVAAAKWEAQTKENERIKLEAEGQATAQLLKAKAEADSKALVATAEAKAVGAISEALKAAQGNPMLVQMKLLEIERARAEKWDGKYPQWMMGALPGQSPNLLLTMPATPQNATVGK